MAPQCDCVNKVDNKEKVIALLVCLLLSNEFVYVIFSCKQVDVAMASNLRNSTNKDACKFYNETLTSVGYCLSLLEDLETAKKVSEGDLNSLKKEIEVGIYRYRKLYEELDGLEIIARGYKRKSESLSVTGYDNSALTEFNDKFDKWVDSCFDELAGFLTELVGLLPVVDMTTVTQLQHQDGRLTVLVSVANKLVCPVKEKEIVSMLELVKLLCDNIENDRSFSSLQTHHRKLAQMTGRMIGGKECKQKEFEQILQDSVRAMKISQENSHVCNSMEDGMEVSRIYYETQTRELEKLVSIEPEMEKKMRERIATRIAVIACKTLLREKFNYSDSRADELMEKLQK